MGVSIIGTVGVPACYGGFESLVEHLLPLDMDVLIYCSGRAYTKHLAQYKQARLIYLPLDANGVQSVPYDILSILHTVVFTKNDLLVLGVSGAIILPVIKPFCKNRKVITNIDGVEWRREKWNKVAKWFLKLSEKIAVHWSDIVIADNKHIQDYVKSEYGAKCRVIPYGGDHVKIPTQPPQLRLDYPFIDRPYAFKVCRIEPENNVHTVLESFSQNCNQDLVLVGNWTKSEYGLNLFKKFSTYPNIHLLNPIYDQTLLNQLRAYCSIYIHGHSAGGTNPSLVEAMYLGLPIIAFDVGYNRETTEGEALYFSNSGELRDKLTGLSSSDGARIGNTMRAIAEKRYTWKIVRNQYIRSISI